MTPWNFPQTIPKRYVLSLIAFFGFFNAYILRSNLSIAIITMAKPTIHISSKNISITQPVKTYFFKKYNFYFNKLFRLVMIGILKLKVIFSPHSSIVIP
jgi:hypothetical protein